MTDKVNPSPNRLTLPFATAGAIAQSGGSGDGWISPSSEPSEITQKDPDIDETNLNAFEEEHGTTFDVSGQDSTPEDVSFGDSGSRLYIVGTGTDSIYEYSLGTAYDVTTASLTDSFDLTASLSTPNPTGMTFNGNGSQLYVTDAANANVAEYSISTNYDVSTATLNATTDLSTQDGSPQDVRFNNDGTLLYIVGDGTDSIYEYSLSTAYDVSTLSLNDSLDVSGQDVTPTGMELGDSGSILYTTGASNANVYEYALSTSYDVSTATFSDSFDVSTQDGSPTGLTVVDSTRFVLSGSGSASVYSYPLRVDWDVSTANYADAIIDAGEAFVYGSWVVTETARTVTLAASTSGQTVALAWDESSADTVQVDLESNLSTPLIPLYDFDTDGSGVTNTVDRRQLGPEYWQTTTTTSDYDANSYETVLADASANQVTVTLPRPTTDCMVNVKAINTTNDVVLATPESQTIDGDSQRTISSQYTNLTVTANGTNYFIV